MICRRFYAYMVVVVKWRGGLLLLFSCRFRRVALVKIKLFHNDDDQNNSISTRTHSHTHMLQFAISISCRYTHICVRCMPLSRFFVVVDVVYNGQVRHRIHHHHQQAHSDKIKAY